MVEIIVIGGGTILVFAVIVTVLFWQRKRPGQSHVGSERILARSLRDEKLKSDIILNAIDDGVVLLDDQLTIQLFNPSASKLTGWPTNEATGIDYRSVLHFVNDKGEPLPEGQDPIAVVFSQKDPLSRGDSIIQTRNNTSVTIDLRISPLWGQDKSLQGAVCVFRDIGEQRRQEAQRADFISTASHEMRTPVAAIEGYLALALNDKVSNIDQKARSFLEKAHQSTQHLGQLFQDLLTSAKAEDGRLTNHPKVVEMSSFVETLTDGLKFAAQKKEISVEFILGAQDSIIDASDTSVVKPLYYITVDPDRIREVLTNLFDNAVKYSDKGKISIGLTGDNDVVQLRVSDTGHGIPAEDIPHLFQKFYRVDNSSTRTVGGTGLGLFICRKIVELYNGRIWVESEVGQGTSFYINLPRLSTDRATELQRNEATQLPQIQSSSASL
jgi:signal transduction histidine kinase